VWIDSLFAQQIIGLLFTRTAWLSKAQLERTKEAARAAPGGVSSAGTSTRSDMEKKTPASRADLIDRAKRLSQSPKPASKIDGEPADYQELYMREASGVARFPESTNDPTPNPSVIFAGESAPHIPSTPKATAVENIEPVTDFVLAPSPMDICIPVSSDSGTLPCPSNN